MQIPKILGKLKTRSGHLERSDIAVWGVMILALIFVLVMALDFYLFFGVASTKPEAGALPPAQVKGISAADIDGVIKLLDDRQHKFQQLLGQ